MIGQKKQLSAGCLFLTNSKLLLTQF